MRERREIRGVSGCLAWGFADASVHPGDDDRVTGKRGDGKWKLWKQHPELGETAPFLLRSIVLG